MDIYRIFSGNQSTESVGSGKKAPAADKVSETGTFAGSFRSACEASSPSSEQVQVPPDSSSVRSDNPLPDSETSPKGTGVSFGMDSHGMPFVREGEASESEVAGRAVACRVLGSSRTVSKEQTPDHLVRDLHDLRTSKRVIQSRKTNSARKAILAGEACEDGEKMSSHESIVSHTPENLQSSEGGSHTPLGQAGTVPMVSATVASGAAIVRESDAPSPGVKGPGAGAQRRNPVLGPEVVARSAGEDPSNLPSGVQGGRLEGASASGDEEAIPFVRRDVPAMPVQQDQPSNGSSRRSHQAFRGLETGPSPLSVPRTSSDKPQAPSVESSGIGSFRSDSPEGTGPLRMPGMAKEDLPGRVDILRGDPTGSPLTPEGGSRASGQGQSPVDRNLVSVTGGAKASSPDAEAPGLNVPEPAPGRKEEHGPSPGAARRLPERVDLAVPAGKVPVDAPSGAKKVVPGLKEEHGSSPGAARRLPERVELAVSKGEVPVDGGAGKVLESVPVVPALDDEKFLSATPSGSISESGAPAGAVLAKTLREGDVGPAPAGMQQELTFEKGEVVGDDPDAAKRSAAGDLRRSFTDRFSEDLPLEDRDPAPGIEPLNSSAGDGGTARSVPLQERAGLQSRPSELLLQARGAEAMARGMAETIHVIRRRDGHRGTVEVSPPELGQVRITVDSSGDAVQVHLRVDSAEVRDMLQQNSDVLKNALESQGLNLTDMSVDVGQQEGGRDSGAGEAFGDEGFSRGDSDPGFAEEQEEDVMTRLDLERGVLYWVA